MDEPVASWINYRRYRMDTAYFMPKDIIEETRLNIQHYILQWCLGNYQVPLQKEKTRTILDSGCGTGIWAQAMAEEFPDAEVVAFDIELPAALRQPKQAHLHFMHADILKPLPFQNDFFDYVHQRLLVAAIPERYWPVVMKELVRVTRPGGYLELMESNFYTNAGPLTSQFVEWVDTLAKRRGHNLALVSSLHELMAQEHMHTIMKQSYPLPLTGGWEGELLAKDILEVSRTYKGLICSILGVHPKVVEEVLTHLQQEWEIYQTAYIFYNYYGQKEEVSQPFKG